MFGRVAAIALLVVQFAQVTAPLVCRAAVATPKACSESMAATSGSQSTLTPATPDRACINQMLCGIQVPAVPALIGSMSLVTHLGLATPPSVLPVELGVSPTPLSPPPQA